MNSTSYRANAVDDCISRIGYVPSAIIDIGGDRDYETARYWLSRGAKSVSVVNLERDFREGVIADGIYSIPGDIRKLTTFFEARSTDLVFGVAIAEHVSNWDIALLEIGQVLRPGGYCYITGCPIWSGATGHHIWVDGTRPYRFTDDTNPIPDWAHLLCSKDEMSALLASRLPAEDIERITSWIYESPNLGRQVYEELVDVFSASSMELVALGSRWRRDPPEHIKQALLGKYGPHRDFGAMDFFGILRVATARDPVATDSSATLLSLVDAPQGRRVRAVRVKLSSPNVEGHLRNFADKFGAGWCDVESRRLRLQFQFVSLFRDAEMEGLWLAGAPHGRLVAKLNPARTYSPKVGEEFSGIPWSGNSRFIIDETVILEDITSLNLMTNVSGRVEKLGSINMTETALLTPAHDQLPTQESETPTLSKLSSDSVIPDTILSNPAFCVMPFVHLHITTTGNFTLCSLSDERISDPCGRPYHVLHDKIEDFWSSDHMNAIRDAMLSGRFVTNCEECYKKERLPGVMSARKKLNRLQLIEGERVEMNISALKHYADRLPNALPLPGYIDGAATSEPRDSERIMASRPFIIYTFRRTGGTSFTNVLGELTGQQVEHEPFNWERTFSPIAQRFRESQHLPLTERIASVAQDIQDIADRQVSIKHCIELHDEALNGLIARIFATRGNYTQIILRRRNEAERLLSLELALQTKAWFKHQEVQRYTALRVGEIVLKPIDVDALVKHHELCELRMNKLMEDLSAIGAAPYQIWYEDLFQSPDGLGEKILDDVTAALGLPPEVWRSNSEVMRLLRRGQQASKDHYSYFPNYDSAFAQLSSAISQAPVADIPGGQQPA